MGMPPGVFNFVTGGGRTAGQELVDNPGIDGISDMIDSLEKTLGEEGKR